MANVNDDRRGASRQLFHQPITITVDRDGKTSTFQAQIVDVSPAGARIRTLAELEPGDVIEFFAADEPKRPARYLVTWTGRRGSDLEGEVGLRIYAPGTGGAPGDH